MSERLHVILALGTTQTLAWGSSFYLPAIVAEPICTELGFSQSFIFGAFSFALLLSGLVGPATGRRIDRHGGRDVLVLSNLVLAAGLAALGLAFDTASLIAAFVAIGLGMGIGLYDAAFATLGRLYGRDARSAITGIALMAGFASTIAWPLTALGLELLGWRQTCFCWATAHIVLGLPLNRLIIPQPPASPDAGPAAGAEPASANAPPQSQAGNETIVFDRNMWLLAVSFAAIWFVAGAMAAHMPAILIASGASKAEAIAASALMGPAQVAARIVEARYLIRFHPLLSARIASFGHPLAAVVLLLAGPIAAPLFGVLHGCGNGILTIARGTVPLAIYGPRNYGYRLGLLGAPARAAQAAAPLLVALILAYGPGAALALTTVAGIVTAMAFLLITPPEREPGTPG